MPVRLSPKKIHPLQTSNDDHASPIDDCVGQIQVSPLLPIVETTTITSCTRSYDEILNYRQTDSLVIDEAEASDLSQVNESVCLQHHGFLSIRR
jgi:hypothetical protein